MTTIAIGRDRRDRRAGGTLVAYRGELFKLFAERRTWLGIATAAIGPIIYLLLELAQGPPGAPLANNLGHTGVGFSLVVFKLIAVFGPAVIASLVAGDIVASEITDGTLNLAAMVAFGRSLGLRVVAEGVEDEETLKNLAGLGCDLAQGYLISRPSSPRP